MKRPPYFFVILVLLLSACSYQEGELKKQGYQKIGNTNLYLKFPCTAKADSVKGESNKFECSCEKDGVKFGCRIFPLDSDSPIKTREEKFAWLRRILNFRKIISREIYIDQQYQGLIYYDLEKKNSQVFFVTEDFSCRIFVNRDNESMEHLIPIVESAKILN